MKKTNLTCLFLIGGLVSIAEQPALAGITLLFAGGTAEVSDSDVGRLFDRVTFAESGSNAALAYIRELNAGGVFDVEIESNSLAVSWDGLHSARRTSQEANSQMYSTLSSLIWFESDLNVLVSVAGAIDFSLHGDEAGAGLVFQVYNKNQDLIHQIFADSIDGPRDGMIQVTESLELKADQQYFLEVHASLMQVALGFSDVPSTATSQVTLTMQSVPEPGTLLLLASLSLMITFRNKT